MEPCGESILGKAFSTTGNRYNLMSGINYGRVRAAEVFFLAFF